jgi:hypothetical protein
MSKRARDVDFVDSSETEDDDVVCIGFKLAHAAFVPAAPAPSAVHVTTAPPLATRVAVKQPPVWISANEHYAAEARRFQEHHKALRKANKEAVRAVDNMTRERKAKLIPLLNGRSSALTPMVAEEQRLQYRCSQEQLWNRPTELDFEEKQLVRQQKEIRKHRRRTARIYEKFENATEPLLAPLYAQVESTEKRVEEHYELMCQAKILQSNPVIQQLSSRFDLQIMELISAYNTAAVCVYCSKYHNKAFLCEPNCSGSSEQAPLLNLYFLECPRLDNHMYPQMGLNGSAFFTTPQWFTFWALKPLTFPNPDHQDAFYDALDTTFKPPRSQCTLINLGDAKIGGGPFGDAAYHSVFPIKITRKHLSFYVQVGSSTSCHHIAVTILD